MTINVSILIVTFNSADKIAPCLDALLSQTGPGVEVIVVDNASRDASMARLGAYADRVRVVASPVNRGFAGGMNLAAAQAAGDILILLNPDTRVRAGWISALVGAFEDPTIGVAGSKGVYPDGRIQHAGGRIDRSNAFASHIGDGEPDEGQYDGLADVDYVSGFALATRRSIWDRLGGLCADFFPAYYEEIDYCFRTRRLGYRVILTPKAAVLHDKAQSSGEWSWARAFLQRQRLYFALRHFGPLELGSLMECEAQALPGWFVDRLHGPGAVRVYAELLTLWPQICVRRADDSTLGGPVSIETQNALLLGLHGLFQQVMALLDQELVDEIAGSAQELLDTPVPQTELIVTGHRLRDKFVKWLIQPYFDLTLAGWAAYWKKLRDTQIDIAKKLADSRSQTRYLLPDMPLEHASAPVTDPSQTDFGSASAQNTKDDEHSIDSTAD